MSCEYLSHAVTVAGGLPAVAVVSAVSALPLLSLIVVHMPLVWIPLRKLLLRLLMMKLVMKVLLLVAVPVQRRSSVVVLSC